MIITLTYVAVPSGPLVEALASAGLLVEPPVPGAVRQALHEGLVPGLAVPAHPAEVAQAVAVGLALAVAAALRVGAVT